MTSLIQHGTDYMIWDAGNPAGSAPEAPKTSILELLSKLNVTADQLKYLGVSRLAPTSDLAHREG